MQAQFCHGWSSFSLTSCLLACFLSLMLLNALEMMLFLIQRGGAQATPRVAFPFLYLECLCFFSSTAVMVRAVRTEMCVAWKVVGPAHDHHDEQHHLQQQHLLPRSSSAIARLLPPQRSFSPRSVSSSSFIRSPIHPNSLCVIRFLPTYLTKIAVLLGLVKYSRHYY
jgi:hypothetical protein